MGTTVNSSGSRKDAFVHPTAIVDEPSEIGPGTKIWHFCHIAGGAKIGPRCNFGQNVYVAGTAVIGENVKIQNNVSVYDGVTMEADVFCGPSMVFTNVRNPRSAVNRRGEYQRTLVKRGATLGANSTIVCGTTVGTCGFVAAGAVVTHDVPDYALVAGVPARVIGYMSAHGERLPEFDVNGRAACPATGEIYGRVDGVVGPIAERK